MKQPNYFLSYKFNILLGFSNLKIFNDLVEKKNMPYKILKYFMKVDLYKEINDKLSLNQKLKVNCSMILDLIQFQKLNIT